MRIQLGFRYRQWQHAMAVQNLQGRGDFAARCDDNVDKLVDIRRDVIGRYEGLPKTASLAEPFRSITCSPLSRVKWFAALETQSATLNLVLLRRDLWSGVIM